MAVQSHGSSWRLVGPWYRWPRPALPEDGRVASPSIQKFAGNSFITDFLATPQHSLKYDRVVDVVNNHDLVSAGPTWEGQFAARDNAGHKIRWSSYTLEHAALARVAAAHLARTSALPQA